VAGREPVIYTILNLTTERDGVRLKNGTPSRR